MAIQNFTAALASRAYRNWFSRLEPNVIKQGSSALREKFERDATKNNFLLTDEKIRDMAAFVTDGKEVSDQEIAQIKARMFESLKNSKNDGVAYAVKDFGVRDPKVGQEIVIENVNFQTIETILNSGFGKKLDGWKRSVGSGYHRGHVYGLPTVLLNETISKLEKLDIPQEDITTVTERGSNLKNFLVNILKAYQQELRAQDLASSNMGKSGIDYDIYAEYTKKPDSFLIEMQVRQTNVSSGQTAGKTFAELKQFLNPEKINQGVLNKILKDIQQPSVILGFLNTKGSPPWIALLNNQIVNAIDPVNKRRDTKTYKISSVPVAKTSIKLTRSEKDKQRVKAELAKTAKLIQELQRQDAKAKTIRTFAGTTNLVKLQNLINGLLAVQIRENMGSGDRTDVLNYRTGRFAESAKVTRMSESRAGMITAFYTYMKNPYATFSEGGRQQTPRSRDPKLLIAKSIREIAQQQVANRLRAVNV
jgi:hypothetical protein